MLDLLTPDDYTDRPYVAGLNQIGHAILGASLALFLGWYAGLLIIAWEGWQLKRRGGLRSDYWGDLSFWLMGVSLYSWVYFMPLTIVAGAAWMVYLDRR